MPRIIGDIELTRDADSLSYRRTAGAVKRQVLCAVGLSVLSFASAGAFMVLRPIQSLVADDAAWDIPLAAFSALFALALLVGQSVFRRAARVGYRFEGTSAELTRGGRCLTGLRSGDVVQVRTRRTVEYTGHSVVLVRGSESVVLPLLEFQIREEAETFAGELASFLREYGLGS